MKIITIVLSTVILSACLLGGATVLAKNKVAVTAAPSDALPNGFDDAKAWSRLEPELQQAYRDAMTANDPSRRFDCFVRDENKINEGDKAFLTSKGFNIRTVGGTLATGYLKAEDLPDVAGLPFLVSIKLAKPPVSGN